ncbi:MAG: hypothetical protein ACKOF9_17685 [Burkholderiales bacterium]
MLLFRTLVLLLLVAAVLCFALYIATRNPRWRQWGLVILKWTVIAGLAFFAVLILERVVVAL